MTADGDWIIVATWVALEGREEELEGVLRELAAASRAEPGCRSYETLRSVDAPGTWVLVECYAGEAGFNAHLTSEHFGRLFPRAQPLLARRQRGRFVR